MRPYSPEMEGFGPESLQPEQGVPTQDSTGSAAASERHKYEQRVRSDTKALLQRLYDEENAARLAAHLRHCGAPQPSAGSGGSLDPSTTFRGIQRQHMMNMPKETQSLFLWDDAILFKPRKQPETPTTESTTTTETDSDAKKTDSLICVACIADWLLAVFATFVVWALYWTCHLWFAAQELPPHVMEFRYTLASATLFWSMVFTIILLALCTISLLCVECPDRPVKHLRLLAHLTRHILLSTSSYLRFWWNHGRQNKPDCTARIRQLDDMDKGAVLLRLSPYPDLFTVPGLGWVNSLYLTYGDWRRWKAVAGVYAGRKSGGTLMLRIAPPSETEPLVVVSYSGLLDDEAKLLSEPDRRGHIYVEVDGS